MRLTRRDAGATVLTAAAAAVYVAFLLDLGLPLVSSVRWATVGVVVLGIVGCGFGEPDLLFKRELGAGLKFYRAVVNVIGVAALAAALVALITANEAALAVLVAATVGMWLLATVRHLTAPIPVTPASVHEETVIPHDARR